MAVTKNKIESNLTTNNNIKEWIVRIGIALFFAACTVSLLIFSINITANYQPNADVSVPLLMWDSIMNYKTGLVAIFEMIVYLIGLKYANGIIKSRLWIPFVLLLLLSIFDNFAVSYPLHQAWIALANYVVVVICLLLLLLQKQQLPPAIVNNKRSDKDIELTKAFEKSNNRYIIAAQLYKIKTSKIIAVDVGESERVRYTVSRIGHDYICAGNDINGISQVTFDLDRSIVDSFQMVLELYKRFRKNCNQGLKNTILLTINEQIEYLSGRLSEIDTKQRDVTKTDCCIARVLTMYLAFKHILNPDASSNEPPADYIGELKLQEGGFNLQPDTEKKLFTIYRTGILGAALLGDSFRHAFQHRKDGTKHNRKYCASQILSIDKTIDDDFTSQTMYVCLFIIKESETPYIPSYLYKSIDEREKAILNMLHNIINGEVKNNG